MFNFLQETELSKLSTVILTTLSLAIIILIAYNYSQYHTTIQEEKQ